MLVPAISFLRSVVDLERTMTPGDRIRIKDARLRVELTQHSESYSCQGLPGHVRASWVASAVCWDKRASTKHHKEPSPTKYPSILFPKS